uniref:Coiled-coil domain-containing protein 112 n=1 Tax=Heliothis virescens TaxID=7102 RepID=A0A2A4JAF4_HELVI
MDLTSSKSSCSTSNVPHTLSFSAKMKRLRIEEHLLLQSISKCISDGCQTEAETNATSYSTFLEFKTFAGKTKNSFREIKLLFQDIKTSTSSQEMLETVDIEDVKKSTIELENRIMAFKSHLQSELARLKSEEQQLNQTEVQEFQDFMMNSANPYGGWNEYHHNIFVNHWQKYFKNQNGIVYDGIDGHVENTPVYNSFLDDLLPKLQDVREDEIVSHIKWYSKFIYLKERQQKAIDKWRSNRKVMKSAQADLRLKEDDLKKKTNSRKNVINDKSNSGSSDYLENISDLVAQSKSESMCSFRRKCCSGDRHSEMYTKENSYGNMTEKTTSDTSEGNRNQALHKLTKSTKQWDIRVNCKDLKVETNNYNLENIKKLRVPTWRTGL